MFPSHDQGGRAGRFYKKKSVVHHASAAGEFPKTDTGELVSNINVRKIGKKDYDVGSRLGAPHGFWLEYGTRNMAARPWLRPSFDKVLKMFRSKLGV